MAQQILASKAVAYLVETAARAPSVHNTQPWRFRVNQDVIELYADPRRRLGVDRAGREMFISCGAALFGLRLGVRALGYLPVVEPLPEPTQLWLLARVRVGAPEPLTEAERELLAALPHRHTHRGPFAADPLPAGLLAGLQQDATAEGATLAVVDWPFTYRQLADIFREAGRRHDADPSARAELRQWSGTGPDSRDGVPGYAFAVTRGSRPVGWLPQRNFDQGRHLGLLTEGGPPPAATAILFTHRDTRADWLRAGQALHRLLVHAATKWVFASLHSEALEAATVRALIRDRLGLPGTPQLLLQFGVADSTHPTPRRPPEDLMEPDMS